MHDDHSAGCAERPPSPHRLRGSPLRTMPATDETRWVVLVLHGGRARSTAPVRSWHLAYRRMIPIARATHRALAGQGTAVWILRNRVRGWNEPRQDAVTDARAALAEIRDVHPGANVVVVGHSMGGRAALRVAHDERVKAVCALAPWIADDEPVEHLRDRAVLIAHGDHDTTTSHRRSAEYAARARRRGHDVEFVPVARSGHAMLRRSRTWNDLVRGFVAAAVLSADPEGER